MSPPLRVLHKSTSGVRLVSLAAQQHPAARHYMDVVAGWGIRDEFILDFVLSLVKVMYWLHDNSYRGPRLRARRGWRFFVATLAWGWKWGFRKLSFRRLNDIHGWMAGCSPMDGWHLAIDYLHQYCITLIGWKRGSLEHGSSRLNDWHGCQAGRLHKDVCHLSVSYEDEFNLLRASLDNSQA